MHKMPSNSDWSPPLHINITTGQAKLRQKNKMSCILSQSHLSAAGELRPLDADLRDDLLSRLEPRPRESPRRCLEPDRDLHSTLTNMKYTMRSCHIMA